MISFVLIIGVYFLLMNKFFHRSVGPVGKSIQKNYIQFPKEAVGIWVLVSSVLFPMLSVIKAREADWDPSQSLSAMASVLGVILGMLVDV